MRILFNENIKTRCFSIQLQVDLFLEKNPNSIPDKFRGETAGHLGGKKRSGRTFIVRVLVSRLGASSPKSTSIFPSFELRIDYQSPSSECGMWHTCNPSRFKVKLQARLIPIPISFKREQTCNASVLRHQNYSFALLIDAPKVSG